MESIVLGIIGVLAVAFLLRAVWKNVQGETSCHCESCSGNCHKKK